MILKRYRCPQAATQQIGKTNPVHANHCSQAPLSSRSRIWMSIGLLFVMLGLCHPSQAQQDFTYNPNHFDTAKIIQAMKTPHSDLVITSAHRGLHAKLGDSTTTPGIPENSISAVEAAAQAGLELLEIDVKLTSDNIPICSHDTSWGRETNPVQAGGNVFDPLTDPTTSTQSALNPFVDSLTADQTQARYNLRDSVSFIANYGSYYDPPATLQNIIDRVNQDQIAAVIAIDVKDTTMFKYAWKVVNTNSAWDGGNFASHVVWKVGGLNFPTTASFKAFFADPFFNDANGNPPDLSTINYWPNYLPKDIDASAFGSEANIIASLNSFWADSTLTVISPEITQKQPGGILDTMRLNNINAGHTIANFAPYKDYIYPNDPTQTVQLFLSGGTDKATGAALGGSCCVDLAHYYYVNPIAGGQSDTADDRGSFDFIVNQMNTNVITTDDVINWDNQLAALGKRNLTYMQASGYQGDPHCNAGNGQYPGCDANNTTVYTYCAPENGACNFSGERVVAFGANGSYRTATVDNTIACNATGVLGPDPLPGVVKACYYGPAILNSSFGPGVYCADENGVCSFNGPATTMFAIGNRVQGIANFSGNSISCLIGNSGFTGNDPAPGLVKTCFYTPTTPNPNLGPAGYVLCAFEGQTCHFAGAARIAFGNNGLFRYRTYPISSSESAAGGAPCTVAEFTDPNYGVVKACYYQYAIPVANSQVAPSGGLTSTGGTFSGPGEPNGSIPALTPDTADTFTVNAGGTSFTVSQPNDSVATYTWTTGGSPSEVLTNASGSGLGYALSNVTVGTYAGAAVSDSITVDPTTTYQTIDGFGGAMTDAAASLILGSSNRSQIMQTLFGTGAGQAGLTMVRSPMGSSDMMASATDIHTYEDTQGSFSATAYASDQRQITALQQAKAIVGSNFKILGTPWSAPGWMKRGGSLLPAQCGTDQNEIDVTKVSQYALYFTGYINAYNNAGLTPWAVSMQNEPENCKTAMPTTLMSPTDEVALAQALKNAIPSSVKVLGWDHNWNDPNFVDALVASGSVDAIGYHCYDGTHYSNQTTSLPTYMTECSGFTASSANVAQNLGWEVANLLIGPLRYGSRGSIYWTLAQDPNGNPHLGGSDACQDCRGMITVKSDGSFEPSQDLYYWAQFSKFVPPGSVRIASNNSGNLSTVAFHNGNQITLVVLNSASTQANGGVAGSDERDLRGHIVQWDGDTAAQKTAWLVGSDGHRRWISDGSTYNCLKYDAGMQGPDVEPGGALDKYINLLNVWAVCGQVTMGTDSELELGTYLKTTGGARLTLTSSGLTSTSPLGTFQWTGPGNRLILQEDGNLVLYNGTTSVWASNTAGSGAIWLSVRDDGTFALFDANNTLVWSSPTKASLYYGKIVQWNGDKSAQPTSWLVGDDGNRRWIPDLTTFNCLHSAGYGNSLAVGSDVLNLLPNLTNVSASCGNTDRIGPNGALDQGANLIAGAAYLGLTSGDLRLLQNQVESWTTGQGHGGAELRNQSDGNVVIYDASNNATWATGTNKSNPGWLILGSDGSLRLWDANNNNIWSRNASEVPVGPNGYFYCGAENSTCTFTGAASVAFGAPQPPTGQGSTSPIVYTYGSFTNGTTCNINAFGKDPDPGTAKACWYQLQ